MDGSTTPNLQVKSGRRWLPWKSRTRSLTSRLWEWVPSWGFSSNDDPISTVVAVLWSILVLPFMIPALLISPFFLIESLLQWMVFPFVLLFRMTGVLPVVVWVAVGHQAPYEERVRGWQRARARTAELENITLANLSMTVDSAAVTSQCDDPYQYGQR